MAKTIDRLRPVFDSVTGGGVIDPKNCVDAVCAAQHRGDRGEI